MVIVAARVDRQLLHVHFHEIRVALVLLGGQQLLLVQFHGRLRRSRHHWAVALVLVVDVVVLQAGSEVLHLWHGILVTLAGVIVIRHARPKKEIFLGQALWWGQWLAVTTDHLQVGPSLRYIVEICVLWYQGGGRA